MAENRKVRTCVVGGGRIGTIHMQNVSRNSRMILAAFVDVDQERAKQIHAEYGVATYSSLEELFSSNADGIDAVIICSPTKTHVDYINICIGHGKPTFCEKPISLAPNEIQAVYQYAEAQKVPLLCGYHRRHDLSFKTLQEAIVNGEIGQVRTIRSCSRDNPIPLNSFLAISGGILHDCASHDIDVMRWIAREEPIEVYASASTFIERIKELNDWDTVSIHLKFPSGILGTVDICRSAPYGYDQRIEVLGEHGMLQAENQRPTTVVRSTVDGVRVDPNCFSFPQRYNQTYALELDHFCDIVLKGVPPAVTGADCYRDAVIIQKCEDSVHTGLPQKVSFD